MQVVYFEAFDFWIPGISGIRREGGVDSRTLHKYSTGEISHLEDSRENAPITPLVWESILEQFVLLSHLWGESVGGSFAYFAVESVIGSVIIFLFDNAE